MVLGRPDAVKAHLLGEDGLRDRVVDQLVFPLDRRVGQLHLEAHRKFHAAYLRLASMTVSHKTRLSNLSMLATIPCVTGKQRGDGQRSAPPDLPSTSYAVLGLLSGDRELSGYDLRKWASNSLHFFYWSPSLSHIYTELRRLEGLGFVSQRIEARGELRSRRLYRITPAGLEALRTWVRTAPVESTVLKRSVALRVWLGHLIGLSSVHEIVAEHVAA